MRARELQTTSSPVDGMRGDECSSLCWVDCGLQCMRVCVCAKKKES